MKATRQFDNSRAEMCAACSQVIEAGERRMRPVEYPKYPVHLQCGLNMAYEIAEIGVLL